MKIKNRGKLVSGGNRAVRDVLVEITEASLESLDSYHTVRNVLALDGHLLRIGDRQWDLRLKRHVLVVGAGKACNAMAKAVEETMGDRITTGLVIVKQLAPEDESQRIELVVGGHPLPNHNGLLASQRILSMVNEATPKDLFVCLISGGSSALMNCPVPGITLEDEIMVTDQLLRSSARIQEINSVRRHISATNGGRLAQQIEAKGAEMINLILSDVVGEAPTVTPAVPAKFLGTPAGPDPTTLGDALNVLRKYDLLSKVPRPVVEFLSIDDPRHETPNSFCDRIHHYVLQRPADACEAAKEAARRMELNSLVLTTLLEGESREAGVFLATVAKEVVLNHRPISPPCVLIAGGETTTRAEGAQGEGGPSQELCLGFALEIANSMRCGITAVDTDGTDGPTEIAGGIADGTTVERARRKGLDVYDHLKRHDSSALLKALGDEIMTGNTGTNVCDLNIIYVC